MTREAAAILIGAMLVAAACGGAPTSTPAEHAAPSATPRSTAPGTAVPGSPRHGSTPARASDASPEQIAAARQAIEAADLGDAQTLDAVTVVRFTDAGKQAAREVLALGPAGDQLWAATWVYASSADDPEPLRPLLQNEDGTIRVMAAVALFAHGERDGLNALEGLLEAPTRLRGSNPPMTVAGFAAFTLARYVDAPGMPGPPENEEFDVFLGHWRDWLAEHAGALTFQPTTGTWMLP